ncbi:ROK family transcriptional regulator [Dickeya chrysanthemi]|uniref:ROK family transcriptional regulator n=1 Tax=Dickeya chrysanthemi TaxID=556 RepID=UPI001CF34955|nr:ROK family transcriptional regulator [Dickeya chrysanthemi]MCA7008994.1 ROK family transcriptional regulator [Dickeya chrysanthemi]
MEKRELTATHRKLLALLRRSGSLSRSALAAASGLTTAAVSMMTRDMLNLGLLEESDRAQGRRGPPHINLRPAAHAGYVLGVYAEYDLICLILMDYAGQCVAQTTLHGDFRVVDSVADTLAGAIRTLLEAQPQAHERLLAVSLALPARFDGGAMPVWIAPGLAAWRGVDIARQLSDRVGCPVLVENDANCAAIGELYFGSAAPDDSFFYLYIGKGIGGALILNGELHRGKQGNAGEIGALRTRAQSRPSFDDLRSCLLAAGESLPSAAADASWQALAASPAGKRWTQRAAGELYRLVYTVTALLDPPSLYLGGTLPAPFMAELQAAVMAQSPAPDDDAPLTLPPVRLSTLPTQNSAAFGAAALALTQC